MPHAYDTLHRSRHAVANIRDRDGDADPGDGASPSPAGQPTRWSAPSILRPRRDQSRRLGALPILDTGNRVNLGKAIALLGWETGQPLVLRLDGTVARVSPGRPMSPAEHSVEAEAQGRLRLPPAALGALGVGPGDQVLATAVPAWDALLLTAAADVLQAQTGWIEPAVPAAAADVPQVAAPGPTSRIRPRWTAPA